MKDFQEGKGVQLHQMQATCALCSIYSSRWSNFLDCGIYGIYGIYVELNGNHVSSSPQRSCHIPILGDYIPAAAQGQMCFARSLPLHPWGARGSVLPSEDRIFYVTKSPILYCPALCQAQLTKVGMGVATISFGVRTPVVKHMQAGPVPGSITWQYSNIGFQYSILARHHQHD